MKRVVVGITGATGACYAQSLLKWLAEHGPSRGLRTDVVLTKAGRMVWQHELGTDPAELGHRIWAPNDFFAPFASGSASLHGMIVAPCTAGTLARIATGQASDLLSRAAEVMLKERKKLVLLYREAPLSLIQIRNMETVTLAGGVVLPATPAFYTNPDTLDHVVDDLAGRCLDQLGIDNDLVRRWEGAR